MNITILSIGLITGVIVGIISVKNGKLGWIILAWIVGYIQAFIVGQLT